MTRYFEGLEVPEGVKAELLRAVIVMAPGSGIVHNVTVARVQDQIPWPSWCCLQTQAVDIFGEASQPVPDLVVLGRDLLPASGRLLPCRLVRMVAEVVSESSVHRDYRTKRSIYAAGKIPAYLVLDPVMAQCVLLTKPTGEGDEADYLAQEIVRFGDRLSLEALGIELDTSDFTTFTGVRPHRYP
ncbi:Uma2 family endonuclease [Streptomyces sp. enrichment culture]|uniref:Uma2 family endonuclease n=1 Tax=Streptomyces sp. enrichment culture TaxID=1795815 RepID=UPI003F576278